MQLAADVIPYLATLAVRQLALAAAALAAIFLLRVKSAAARHAVWTAVVAGMLLLSLGPLFPGIPLRILRSLHSLQPAIAAFPEGATSGSPAPAPPTWRAATQVPAPIHRPFIWQQAAAAVYFAGLAVFLCMLGWGYRITRGLVSASRPLECLGVTGVFESSWIAVPVTLGFFRPRILLPVEWREWPAEKLAAVLVHERTHVARADWAIAVAAGINRRLFWFHPLAWWLERHLAVLAERACDDAALLALGAREAYAQTLLDMAAAVQSRRGRMLGEAMAMAKTAEVRRRIERILDEARPIPRGLTRARWVTLAACGLPLLYLVSVTQLASAQVKSAAPFHPLFTSPLPPHPPPRFFYFDASPLPADGRRPFRRDLRSATQGEFATSTTRVWSFHLPAARPRWFPFSNYADLSQMNSPPQATLMLEVDASSQPPYAYRLNMPNVLPVHKVDPIYSAEARESGIQGDVTLSVVIGTDGHVLSVQPIAGNPLLEAAAMDAVRQYIYQPKTMGNGEPAEVQTSVTIPFRLDGVTYDVRQEPITDSEVQVAWAPTHGAVQPGVNSPPQLIYKVEPEYPMEARAAQIQGTVRISIDIGADGVPGKGGRASQSVAGFALELPALQAVRQWRFKPAYKDSQPVACEAIVEITFRLL